VLDLTPVYQSERVASTMRSTQRHNPITENEVAW